MSILERINRPADLRNLSIEELGDVAGDIRKFMVDVVSKTGGHIETSPAIGFYISLTGLLCD